MQINFFLLLQAFNQGQIDLKHFQFMLSILKAMKANLGKTGSLVEKPNPHLRSEMRGARTGRRKTRTEPHPSTSRLSSARS